MHREIVDLEHNLSAGAQPRLDQILHHFLLRVHRDRAAAGQLGQVDAVPAPTEAEPDAVVPQSFTTQPLAHAGLDHQVDSALLQHARAHALLNVLAAAALEDDGFNAAQVQQMREHQAGGSRADDTDLSSHAFPSYQRGAARVELEEMASNVDAWPELPLAAWQDTYDTLHMWTQIVGKIRMTLTPLINHYWNATLYVSARGLTTSPIPYPGGIFQIDFDFIAHKLVIETSRGDVRSLDLAPRTVADFYSEVMSTLAALKIEAHIHARPDEVANPIPFADDRTHKSYDREYVERFRRILISVDQVLKNFRTRFIGKCSPVHFFWGSFDIAVTRFSGRLAPPRSDPQLREMMQEAYSHEVSSAGFWPGGGDIKGPRSTPTRRLSRPGSKLTWFDRSRPSINRLSGSSF